MREGRGEKHRYEPRSQRVAAGLPGVAGGFAGFGRLSDLWLRTYGQCRFLTVTGQGAKL